MAYRLLTPGCWIYIRIHKKYICISYNFSIMKWSRWLKTFLIEDKDQYSLYSHFHSGWCPGDARSHGISSNDIALVLPEYSSFNTRRVSTLWPRQNGRHFPDAIFKCIFLNENVWISLKISLKFVPKGPINNIPALVQIMAWHRPGDKPLSEPMMYSLLTHICIIRPQ